MSEPLHLFEGFGIELEYMIVDAGSLAVRPISDVLLCDEEGEIDSEMEHGSLAWSNELTSHVIELKTNGPATSLEGLAAEFQSHIGRINGLLSVHNAALMPTAMHPLMDPHREMKLWEHDYSPVYEAFDRIFSCHGHGWANLQSVHINLPFYGDEEFGRLHAAIRLVLPLLPALAASSPVVEGHLNGTKDNRLAFYRTNARAIPSITARVIPEAVFTCADYDREIFQRMYRDIAPHDPNGMLQHEWLNARGAIARFDRGAIEIRVLDIQEYPLADLAVCAAVVAVLKKLVAEDWSSTAMQMATATDDLAEVLERSILYAEDAVLDKADYLKLFGIRDTGDITAGQLWSRLLEGMAPTDLPDFGLRSALAMIVENGTLSTRIAARLASDERPEAIVEVYRELVDCLAEGRPFV